MAMFGRTRTDDIHSRIENIQEHLSALGESLEERAETIGAHAHSRARALRTSAGETANDLGSQIENLAGLIQTFTGRFTRGARKRSGNAYQAVESRIEDNAMIAVVAALGVGFLLGALSRGSGGR